MRNGRLDVLGANPLGRALYSPLYDSPERIAGKPVNTARIQFLDPEAFDETDGTGPFALETGDRLVDRLDEHASIGFDDDEDEEEDEEGEDEEDEDEEEDEAASNATR